MINMVKITLCDVLNPGFGYQIRIEQEGNTIFFTGVNPKTGKDLLTMRDCLEVTTAYLEEMEETLIHEHEQKLELARIEAGESVDLEKEEHYADR